MYQACNTGKSQFRAKIAEQKNFEFFKILKYNKT